MNRFICSLLTGLFLITLNQAEAIGGRGGGGGGRDGGGEGGREHPGGGQQRQFSSQGERGQGERSQGQRPQGEQFQGQRSQGERAQMQRPQQQRAQGSGQAQRYDSPSFSMSRADGNRSPQAYSRPSESQLNSFLGGSGNKGAFTQSNPAATRQNLQQYMQPSARSQQNLKSSLSQLTQANSHAANQTNQQFQQQHPNANGWFGSNFNNQHGLNANNLSGNWWKAANWTNAANWAGFGGYPAYYYDDGGAYTELPPQDANTYSPPPQQNVYITNQAAPSSISSTPIPQETQGQDQGQDQGQQQGDWLPLGVFTFGANADQAAYSNMVVQLALSKAGYLSGTYYNASTDKAYPMEGAVDRATQKAVWKLSNNADSPVAATGLYNLTQDVVPIQVHFPDGSEQNKVLVRLQQPAS